MTIVSTVSDFREWYENDTILIDKNGLSGTVVGVGIGTINPNTILVNPSGLSGVTEDV